MNLNYAHIHLLVNHVPVIGLIAGLFFFIWAMVRNNEEMKRASLVGFILLALITPLAFYTGDPAEKIVRHEPGVTREAIHEHEEAADYAFISIIVVAVLCIVSLLLRRGGRPPARWADVLVLVAALFSTTVFARVAYLGGEIRHTEVRPGAVAPAAGEERERD